MGLEKRPWSEMTEKGGGGMSATNISPGWQKLFWAAAAYNFLIGLPSILAPGLAMSNLGLPVPHPLYAFNIQIMGILICTFGLGYLMVAQSQPGAKQILTLGIVGKLGILLLLGFRMLSTPMPLPIIATSFGDLFFATMFAFFLFGGSRDS